MNSLEFVNREIEILEDLLKTTEFKPEGVTLFIDRLNHFKQIKSKLEIMELIENGWSHMEQTLSGEKIIKFGKLNLDDWLKVWKTLEEIGLKKALEVGNNHE